MKLGYEFAYLCWLRTQPWPTWKRYHLGSVIIFGSIQEQAGLERQE